MYRGAELTPAPQDNLIFFWQNNLWFDFSCQKSLVSVPAIALGSSHAILLLKEQGKPS